MFKKMISVILMIILLVSMATCSMATSETTRVTNVGKMGVNIGIVIIQIILILIVYLIPTIVACVKKHTYKVGIILLDIFLGWSLIGWVGALIWACILPDNKKINNNKYEDLENLQKLKEDGAITEAEFEIEKAKILR